MSLAECYAWLVGDADEKLLRPSLLFASEAEFTIAGTTNQQSAAYEGDAYPRLDFHG